MGRPINVTRAGDTGQSQIEVFGSVGDRIGQLGYHAADASGRQQSDPDGRKHSIRIERQVRARFITLQVPLPRRTGIPRSRGEIKWAARGIGLESI